MSRTLPLVSYPPGKRIPGTVYRVVGRIGTGGMGTVYEVEDTSVGRRYALKTLLSNEGDLADITRRLVREARLTAALRHRNIVEVITAGTTGDDPPLPFYVMELLSGIPLRALMKSRAVPLDHVHQIGTELLDGLYQAHNPIGPRDKPLVHCDLKPENIFLALDVSGKSTVKILDFGIAAAVGAQKTRGTFAGTPKYAAPEQFTGGSATPQTDLYAVACVLYEMLAGVGPFPLARTAVDYARAHTSLLPRPLSDRIALPPEVERVILAALAKDPAARPRDAYAFMVGLDALRWVDAAVLPADANRTDEMLETAVSVLGLSSNSSAGFEPHASSGSGDASGPPNAFAATKPSAGNEGPRATEAAPTRPAAGVEVLSFDREAHAQSIELALSWVRSGSVDRAAVTITSPERVADGVSSRRSGHGTERLPARPTPLPAAGRRAEPAAASGQDSRAERTAARPLLLDQAMTDVDGTPWFQREEASFSDPRTWIRAGARARIGVVVAALVCLLGVGAVMARGRGVRSVPGATTNAQGAPDAGSMSDVPARPTPQGAP